jgi:hypothetical protein
MPVWTAGDHCAANRIGLGMTVSKRTPNACAPASLANDSFDGQEKTRVSDQPSRCRCSLFGCQKQFDTRAGAQKMGSVGLQLIDILEAGVGIEPAYTALQAAAQSDKSIRCVRLTPSSTVRHPGPSLRTCLLAYVMARSSAMQLPQLGSQECKIHRPHSRYAAVCNATRGGVAAGQEQPGSSVLATRRLQRFNRRLEVLWRFALEQDTFGVRG